ncbi:hypothetical protein CSA17_06235 [bacterium DOLJORAL78_65_58]|nr:MAG: hypothetical protein CSB20_12830 [bacterium DOLZORAL124_64_63]PIE75667.1 MAG: hypothetical protein CSA17_06235 [bacterium DOLJORAL78_65_58]
MPLVQRITGVVSMLFDLLLAPFTPLPWLAMVVVCVITAAWALQLFKWATPQTMLNATRDRLIGHIYEMGLYQDHLRVLARIQGRLALANLRYLSLTLPALLVMIPPMILTLGQIEGRFAQRPLQKGEETVLTVYLADAYRNQVSTVEVGIPAGLEVTAGPVRNQHTGTVSWRLQVLEPGRHELAFRRAGQGAGRFTLEAAGGLPLLHRRTENSAWKSLLYPGSLVIREAHGLDGISVQWPKRHTRYLGLPLPWLPAFMILSLLAGLGLKKPLRVSL